MDKKLFKGPEIPTPFGRVKLPEAELPPLGLPKMPDDKGRAAIGHGVGHDLAGVLTLIPFVGSFLADGIQDLHFYSIKGNLTPEQYARFIKYDKLLPTDTLPLIRTLGFKD